MPHRRSRATPTCFLLIVPRPLLHRRSGRAPSRSCARRCAVHAQFTYCVFTCIIELTIIIEPISGFTATQKNDRTGKGAGGAGTNKEDVMQWSKALLTGALASAISVAATTAAAQTRGVSKDEILLGSHIDLSGPIAELGRAGVNSARMAEEEINARGGINGRKLRILFEDSGYDPKKAVLVTQKLIEKDGI